MTDFDDRYSRSKSTTPPVASQSIPLPGFQANHHLDAPRLHAMPTLPRLNLQAPVLGAPAMPANSISLNGPEDPFGFHNGPRHNLAPQRLAEEYGIYMPPKIQLPANWDAPLQNPIPVVPPISIPPRRGQ